MKLINTNATLVISTQERSLKEDSQLTMDFMVKLRDFLIEENFQPEDVFPTLIYISIQMFLDGFENLDLGKGALLKLVDESIKSQMDMRKKFEEKKNPVILDLFKDFVEEHPEQIH